MKSTVENSCSCRHVPSISGTFSSGLQGLPLQVFWDNQCPIHPLKTLPPLCHAPAPEPTMAFYWASQWGIWLWVKTLQSFAVSLYFLKRVLHSRRVGLLTIASLTSCFILPLCVALGSSSLDYPLCAFLTTHSYPSFHAQDMSSYTPSWYQHPSLYFQCLDIRNYAINTCWLDNFEYIWGSEQ